VILSGATGLEVRLSRRQKCPLSRRFLEADARTRAGDPFIIREQLAALAPE